MADLSVVIAGVRFKNPIWTSSSEVTENFDKMKRAFDLGAGAVVAKSYTNSREYRMATEIAKYNIMGEDRRPVYGRDVPKMFSNYCRTGIGPPEETEDGWFDEVVKTMKYAKKMDGVVVGSVFGTTDTSEMVRLSKRMQDIGVPMIELDLACPQGEELHDKGGIVKSCDTYVDITRKVAAAVKIPIFVKLSPQQADLSVTAKACKEAGAAGVCCHNRFLGFFVDIDKETPYSWGWAGVGGPWMLPVSLRWVSKIYNDDHNFPILGSSGAYDWEDVVRFLMAGASSVEFCSTIMAKGFWVVGAAVKGLNDFMDAKGKSVRDIIGVATRNSHTYQQMFTLPGYKEKSTINQDLCIHCGKCKEICWYYAIESQPGKGKAPCSEACPAGIDSARYVQLTAQKKYDEAIAVVREKIPFPFVCGIACVHPCETKCLRGHLEEPISIMAIKGFLAENDTGAWQKKVKKAKPSGKKVAIIGSGPAGLTAGYYLAKQGHRVTVFESGRLPGGMMRTAIPEYRLPMEILDEEIDGIKATGVKIKTRTKVESLDELMGQGYDAVFVATGANVDLPMRIEGEDTPGVMPCLSFLNDVKMGKRVNLGDEVIVIGGGNAAVDAARTAARFGAYNVTILYRRTRAEMPATADEVEAALAEGINIKFLAAPTKINKCDGHLEMECVRMKLGKPDASGRPRPVPVAGSEFNVCTDNVIVAVGEAPDVAGLGLKLNGSTLWANTETLATSRKGVFAGGDVVSGPASIIESIAAGRKAAASIDKYLGGKGNIDEVLAPPAAMPEPMEAPELPEEHRVPQIEAVPLAKRLLSFDMPEGGYTEEDVVKEASRCLKCQANYIYNVNEDKCKGCHNCMVLCPVKGCINMKTVG
ncbi:MAG: FAD-dependent oxidoreductase [Chloroflexota bacterium]|nr:FAD-dependent oxidoreductase [Chloroflexota bacterium]